MLTELCQELHNWFDLIHYSGRFEVTGGVFTASFLAPGQYYRIIGSVFNDGVHKYTGEIDPDLTDEVWTGYVWALGIPKAVIDLADQIKLWNDKYGGAESAAMSPYTSESFGGYSYSKGGSGSSNSATSTSWQSAFRAQLKKWRKL